METYTQRLDGYWKSALSNWFNPSIPKLIAINNEQDAENLGEIGMSLKSEFAFMDLSDFQTYANLEKIRTTFSENPNRGIEAILTHEIGHRFCPYDKVTLMRLRNIVKKEIKEKTPHNQDILASLLLNYYEDMCINTKLVKSGNKEIPWIYQELLKKEQDSKLLDVYARSMELTWGVKIIPDHKQLNLEEEQDSRSLASLFIDDYFNKERWNKDARKYAAILVKYAVDSKKDGGGKISDNTKNIPEELDEKIKKEIIKKISAIGKNKLPENTNAITEVREIFSEFGKETTVLKASKEYYEALAELHDVEFASSPFGNPRVNPFRPKKWNPGDSINKLNIDHSVMVGGRIIPGINTYAWEKKISNINKGQENLIPNLDLFIDSSGSMVNPITEISLPVLAGFVIARKAKRKGAQIRATNFSGIENIISTGYTQEINEVYDTLLHYFGNGTVFPVKMLIDSAEPRQVIIITDGCINNREETAEHIRDFKEINRKNKISIYAITPIPDSDEIEEAGAEIIQGTTTDIFKKIIGKADQVYRNG